MRPALRRSAGIGTLIAVSALAGCSSTAPDGARAPTVYAAGSLRAALTEAAQAFGRTGGPAPRLVFGASGLLKDRLAGGEQADVFASANMAHPQALVDAGRAGRVQPFARNALCALAAPGFSLEGRSLAERLLDERVRVGTSTPRADPSGDYAFTMFERIESTGASPAGSAQRLKRKALQLTGGPASPPPPPDRSVYGMLMQQGAADVFVTYCTNAAQARREVPSLRVLDVPEAINVSATYGLAVLSGASPSAERFVDFLLGPAGQAVLAAHGFHRP